MSSVFSKSKTVKGPGGQYIAVSQSEWDAKLLTAEQPTLDMKVLGKVMSGSRKGGGRVMRTKLVFAFATDSAAGASYNASTSLQPSASPEYTTFAALFDEVFVHGGVMHFRGVRKATSVATVVPTGTTVYDPVDASSAVSVAASLVAQQKFGPYTLASPPLAAGNTVVSPIAFNKTGYWAFKFKCPTGPQDNKGVVAVQTGQWAATADTTAVFGYLRTFISADSGTGTVGVEAYVEIDVSFRSRA
jgi:hypothetical protein